MQNCIHDGFKPTLAFVFITAVEDIDGVVAILDAAGISIFGASTSEKFTEEGIEPDGIVVLLMDMDPANFKIVLKDFEAPSIAYEKACETGEAGKTAFEHPAFIISTADISIPGEEIIKGLMDKAGQEITIVGGGAGEPVNFSGIVFTNPTCALCTAEHYGALPSGDVGCSTTNRNFIGKVGKGSHTYLMSPMSAMATAVKGVITDPRDILG